MGNIFSALYSKFYSLKYFNILILGLYFSGKTTFLYHLKPEGPEKSNPYIGFDMEKLNYENFNFTSWDVGEANQILVLWRHYYYNKDGLIFIVDSEDKERIEDAYEEFKKLLNEEKLKGCPILVLANKQDLNGAFTPYEINEKFRMNEIKGRNWIVKGICSKTGEGIKEALDWMNSVLIIKNNL